MPDINQYKGDVEAKIKAVQAEINELSLELQQVPSEDNTATANLGPVNSNPGASTNSIVNVLAGWLSAAGANVANYLDSNSTNIADEAEQQVSHPEMIVSLNNNQILLDSLNSQLKLIQKLIAPNDDITTYHGEHILDDIYQAITILPYINNSENNKSTIPQDLLYLFENFVNFDKILYNEMTLCSRAEHVYALRSKLYGQCNSVDSNTDVEKFISEQLDACSANKNYSAIDAYFNIQLENHSNGEINLNSNDCSDELDTNFKSMNDLKKYSFGVTLHPFGRLFGKGIRHRTRAQQLRKILESGDYTIFAKLLLVDHQLYLYDGNSTNGDHERQRGKELERHKLAYINIFHRIDGRLDISSEDNQQVYVYKSKLHKALTSSNKKGSFYKILQGLKAELQQQLIAGCLAKAVENTAQPALVAVV